MDNKIMQKLDARRDKQEQRAELESRLRRSLQLEDLVPDVHEGEADKARTIVKMSSDGITFKPRMPRHFREELIMKHSIAEVTKCSGEVVTIPARDFPADFFHSEHPWGKFLDAYNRNKQNKELCKERRENMERTS